MFSANFQITYTSMTCSRPIRRTGPLQALASQIFFSISGALFSAVRVMEIAFKAKDPLPEIIKRLFAEASQAKTSSVMHSSYKAMTNLTASNVSLEFKTKLPCSSWTDDPKAYMTARMAILVSISEARPIPIGWPCFFLILAPPTRTSSQVSGYIPTESHRSLR